MIAYCGLNCSICPAYLATQADDDKMRADCAKKWSAEYKSDVKPEQINCDGCKPDGRKFFVCKFCKVKKCAEERAVENCAACPECICDKLKEVMMMDPNIKKALEELRGK